MAKFDFLSNELLDHVFGGAAYSAPATVYAGLSTTTPNKDGTGVTEPSGNNYARVAITANSTNFPAASGGAMANGTDIQFPTPSGSWGQCTHLVLFDASTNGNKLAFGALTVAQTPVSGNTVVVPTGDLDLTEA